MLFRIANASQIHHIDGIELHALQTVAQSHQISHILNIDIGRILGKVLGLIRTEIS